LLSGAHRALHSFPTRRSSDLLVKGLFFFVGGWLVIGITTPGLPLWDLGAWWSELIVLQKAMLWVVLWSATGYNESWGPLAFKFRSEEHTSELQSRENLVCRLL